MLTGALVVAFMVAAVGGYAVDWMRREVARLDDENRRLRTELAVLRAAHRAHVEEVAA